MQRIDDNRLESVEQADLVMADITKLEVAKELEKARANSKIATVKANLVGKMTEIDARLNPLTRRLAAFITGNAGLFKKPRKRKMEAGEYGFQAVSELVIDNEELMLKNLVKGKHYGCIKREPKPVKTAIAKLLKKGITISGCHLKTGDTVVHKPSPKLIKAAKAVE